MKIEEGMYVRTKYGIAKILSTSYTDDIVEDFLVIDKELEIGLISGCDWALCDKKDVIKASHNIIDLIEIGDYVNGCKVLIVNIDNEKDVWTTILDNGKILVSDSIKSILPIKSIVTKEQFENAMYKVN